MSEAYISSAMAGHRQDVRERMEAGDPFGEVETAIDGIAELSEDQRAALWLFAFAKRGPDRRRPAARAQLTFTS